MARILTAGVPSPESETPTKRRPSYPPELWQGDVEAHLWGIVAELWRLGRRHREITPLVAKLDTWLTRAQAWQRAHEDAPDAEERWARYRERDDCYKALSADLVSIDRHAQRVRESLETHWNRLHPKRQTKLRAEPGWSRAHSGNRVAGEMWRAACEGKPYPDGEPSFALIGFLVMLGGLINV